MLTGISTLEKIGLPKQFGFVLLVVALSIMLAPYVGGADFGVFRIPKFPREQRTRLIIGGPIALLLSVLLFVPMWSLASGNSKEVQVIQFVISKTLLSELSEQEIDCILAGLKRSLRSGKEVPSQTGPVPLFPILPNH